MFIYRLINSFILIGTIKANNLKWCTHKENMNNENTKLSKIINEFNSIQEAKKYMYEKHGYKSLGISDACYGKIKQTGGFEWKFKE